MNESKVCALYVRVSTADQGERYSLPSQMESLRRKAEREGYIVREDLIFTDKHTGKVAERPGFEHLNAAVKAGRVGAVLVFSVDRFARRTEDALRIARDYKRHGVKLDFVEAPYEDTPTGRFTFTQLASFAELWGEKILADSARGRHQKLTLGKLDHGTAPYGYIHIDKRQKDGARFELDGTMATPELSRADVVRMIFRLRLQNMPTYRIAVTLRDAGILSAGCSGHPPGPWSRQVILQMLKNPTYMGKHLRAGVVVPCPKIIEEADFERVQESFQTAKAQHGGRPSTIYLLRSFIWCGKRGCGKRCMGLFKPNGPRSYRCGNVDPRTRRRLCPATQVDQSRLESAAWRAIWEVLTTPDLLLKLGNAYRDQLQPAGGKQTAALEKELARAESGEKRIRRMMADELIDYDEGAREIHKHRARSVEIRRELESSATLLPFPKKNIVEAALREIAAGDQPETYEERRAVLEKIEGLRMEYFDNDLVIEGRVPIPDASAGKKKCNSGVDAAYTSFAAIPFKLKVRVAA